MAKDLEWVKARLEWMKEKQVWPDGLRYLWTDAFGVVLLCSLYEETGASGYLDEAERVVAMVDEVLGRRKGYRIGEEADRDGQYFHYLAMWLFALYRLGEIKSEYRAKGVSVAKAIHAHFVIPGAGVIWKMEEDLSAPYPGYGLGALDAFDGYMAYRLLDEQALVQEIGEMRDLMDATWPSLDITQDLGIGMMLWMAAWFPDEEWAQVQAERGQRMLERMWVDQPGYFMREPGYPEVKFAFTNYGISVGLQAQDIWPERVEALNRFFDSYRSGDEYDVNAITHVMGCCSHFPGLLLPDRPAAK